DIASPRAEAHEIAVADRGGKPLHREPDGQLKVHRCHAGIIDKYVNLRIVRPCDAVGRKIHHHLAAWRGNGALGRRVQVSNLAPSLYDEFAEAEVEVEQAMGSSGDLVADCAKPSTRQGFHGGADGAEGSLFLQGIGHRVNAGLVAADNADRADAVASGKEKGCGGHWLSGDGSGHRSVSLVIPIVPAC